MGGAIFAVLVFVVFGACVALTFSEGTWGNAIRLIVVVTAGLLATSLWEPMAKMLEGIWPGATYWYDFLSLWVVFSVSVILIRLLTDSFSKYSVRFISLADKIGSVVLAVLTAWVMVCFISFTLHTAPMGEKFLRGGFDADTSMCYGLAPDRQWMGFVNLVSRGSFSPWSGDTSGSWDSVRFRDRYKARRAALESHVKSNGPFFSVSSAPKR